jgi:YbbR domain-containing protein
MFLKSVRWLGANLSTLLLALVLAVVVWISAVTSANPNEVRDLPRTVPIEIVGQDSGLVLMGNPANSVRLRLEAPKSVWTQLTGDVNTVRAWVDLSGLTAGAHTVPVQVIVNQRPVRLARVDPKELRLTLEPLVTQTLSVILTVNGSPALGYEANTPTVDPIQVTVSGAQSVASKVRQVGATLDISGASQSIEKALALSALDQNGEAITGLTITPASVTIDQPIVLRFGYRNVIVKVATIGQPADGFKLTSILVNPPNVVISSATPQLLNLLPGYVETEPLDLTGVVDDLEATLRLVLPEGVSVAGQPDVIVQVGIAAIESSITVPLPITLVGGPLPGYRVDSTPEMVDVTFSGPVEALNNFDPLKIQVKVDVTGKEAGSYSISPVINFVPSKIQVVSVLPSDISIVITKLPTPTPTSTPMPTPTPTPEITSTPTATAPRP